MDPKKPDQNQRTVDSQRPTRLLSLDTFRGLIMCVLAVDGLAVAATAKKLGYVSEEPAVNTVEHLWRWLAFHNSHPSWNSQFYFFGCSFWDLIQPAFMFMVGVAMPYSYASRRSRGHSPAKLKLHALIRATVLVLLGVFLATRTSGIPSNRLFTNVLAQIGLGYFFVFLLLGRSAFTQMVVGLTVLIAYAVFLMAAPVAEPLPPKSIESISTLSVPNAIAEQYALHTNGAAQADIWILGLERGETELPVHPAGYATLNFIPATVTMLLGVWAGTLLRDDRTSAEKIARLLVVALVCFAVSIVASFTVCPIVKKIWTPAWVLYSGSLVLCMLTLLYWIIDVRGFRRWTLPLVVVGTNSLAMYMMTMLMKGWIASCCKTYLGKDIFSGVYGSMTQAMVVFTVLWLLCLYFYRNRLFFRI